jgi:hypothetical protein
VIGRPLGARRSTMVMASLLLLGVDLRLYVEECRDDG